jgi:sigma-B regulation protein RsbU (phosphoserine phosphatase)
MSNGDLGFIVGDIAGKGSPAALLAAAVLGMFSAEAFYQTGSSSPITRVNAGLFRRAIEARFLTAFYGILHKDGSLIFTNAGHNPPILVKKNSIMRLEAGGVVLGLFETATFEQEQVMLEKGDVLLAFSDGVTEAMNEANEEFGDDQLVALMRNRHGQDPRKILKELIEEVKKFTGDALQSDDVTMMAVRYEG